jgi:hypothetical protein
MTSKKKNVGDAVSCVLTFAPVGEGVCVNVTQNENRGGGGGVFFLFHALSLLYFCYFRCSCSSYIHTCRRRPTPEPFCVQRCSRVMAPTLNRAVAKDFYFAPTCTSASAHAQSCLCPSSRSSDWHTPEQYGTRLKPKGTSGIALKIQLSQFRCHFKRKNWLGQILNAIETVGGEGGRRRQRRKKK